MFFLYFIIFFMLPVGSLWCLYTCTSISKFYTCFCLANTKLLKFAPQVFWYLQLLMILYCILTCRNFIVYYKVYLIILYIFVLLNIKWKYLENSVSHGSMIATIYWFMWYVEISLTNMIENIKKVVFDLDTYMWNMINEKVWVA